MPASALQPPSKPRSPPDGKGRLYAYRYTLPSRTVLMMSLIGMVAEIRGRLKNTVNSFIIPLSDFGPV